MNWRIRKKKEKDKAKKLNLNIKGATLEPDYDANFDNPGLPNDDEALKK